MSAFIDQERGRFGVEPICRELEVSDRAYRQRRGGKLSRRGQRDLVLLEEIRRVHAESDSSYGSWRCWRQLNRDGTTVARCTVERLMRHSGLAGVVRGKTQRTTTPGSNPVAAADLVKRRFHRVAPGRALGCRFHLRAHLGGLGLPRHRPRRLLASREPGRAACSHTDNGSQPGLNRSSQHWFVDLIVNTHSMLPPASASQAFCAVGC